MGNPDSAILRSTGHRIISSEAHCKTAQGEVLRKLLAGFY
jgi:hypothetical protein